MSRHTCGVSRAGASLGGSGPRRVLSGSALSPAPATQTRQARDPESARQLSSRSPPHAPALTVYAVQLSILTLQRGNDRAYIPHSEAHRSAGTRADALPPQNLPPMSDDQPRVGLLIPAQDAISGRSLTTRPGPHSVRSRLQVLCGPSPRRQLRKRNRNPRVLPHLS